MAGKEYNRGDAETEICHWLHQNSVNAVLLPSCLYSCGVPLHRCRGNHTTAAAASSCEKAYASGASARQSKRKAFKVPLHGAVAAVCSHFGSCEAFVSGQVLFQPGSKLRDADRGELNELMTKRRGATALEGPAQAPMTATNSTVEQVRPTSQTSAQSIGRRLASTLDTDDVSWVAAVPDDEIRAKVDEQKDQERAEWEATTGQPLSEAASTRLESMGASLEQHLQTTRDTAAAVQTLQTDVREVNAKLENHEGRLQSLETKACPASGENLQHTQKKVKRASRYKCVKWSQPNEVAMTEWLRTGGIETADGPIALQMNLLATVPTGGGGRRLVDPEYHSKVLSCLPDQANADSRSDRALHDKLGAIQKVFQANQTTVAAANAVASAVTSTAKAVATATASAAASAHVDVTRTAPDGTMTRMVVGAQTASHTSATSSVELDMRWAVATGLDEAVELESTYTPNESGGAHLREEGFGHLLFKLHADTFEQTIVLRYEQELALRTALLRVRRCDNKARDRSAGSSPNFDDIEELYAGVYAVGVGRKGIASHIASRLQMQTPTIYARTSAEAREQCAPLIAQFVELLQEVEGTAKAGASSLGKRKDGTSFDSTKGRWRAHLGNYFPLQNVP
eukprot:COSAG02_NODE_5001_length_4730_cov_106.047938_4_plen_627_part_00